MQTATTKSPEVLETPIAVLVEEHGGPTRVAKDAGVDHTTLWRAVNGRFSPSHATRLKLARVFRCRVDEVRFPTDAEQG